MLIYSKVVSSVYDYYTFIFIRQLIVIIHEILHCIITSCSFEGLRQLSPRGTLKVSHIYVCLFFIIFYIYIHLF